MWPPASAPAGCSRAGAANSASALVQHNNAGFQSIPEAMIFVLDPPTMPSLGNATGFTMKLQDPQRQP